MAIKPKCDKCGKELNDFGAILLSPPDKKNKVRKFHLCRKCHAKIAQSLKYCGENGKSRRTP